MPKPKIQTPLERAVQLLQEHDFKLERSNINTFWNFEFWRRRETDDAVVLVQLPAESKLFILIDCEFDTLKLGLEAIASARAASWLCVCGSKNLPGRGRCPECGLYKIDVEVKGGLNA